MRLMSMKELINHKEKVYMQKFLLVFIGLYFYSGCSSIELQRLEVEELSCSKEAEPKSLQLLEQQYRCTSQE